MSTPIKTGAWLYDEQRGEYLRCDLYEYAETVLVARVNPLSVTREPPPDEGIWATMHEVEDNWPNYIAGRVGTEVYVATYYTIHYMMQFMDGSWHDIKLTGTQKEIPNDDTE